MIHMNAKRMRRKRMSKQRRAARLRIVALSAIGVIAAVLVLGGLALNREIKTIARETAHLNIKTLGQNTAIYDRYGQLLGIVAGEQNRTIIANGQIPTNVKNATIAIEDKRFYEHHGIDYVRLLGAAVHDVTGGGGLQGASTITMQLMKVLALGGNDQSFSGKLKQAYLAVQYEKTHTKQQILDNYLNSVFYGNNAVGIEAASLTYFDTHAKNMSLTQAALLAGLPQAPSDYDPFRYPKSAVKRRNEVLQQMAAQHFISQSLAARAQRAGLGLHPGNAYSGTPKEGYFFQYVKQNLQQVYGQARLADQGLKVYTTIDPKLDLEAQQAINSQLGQPGDPEAAIVMIDSHTGAIRAMTSTQPFSQNNQFNYVTQALRQPGSTFKPFVLTTAVNRGINPYTTTYVSRPLNFFDPTWGQINVATYSNTYAGRINIYDATLQSDNSVYTQMTLDLGPQAVVNTAYTMGIPRTRNLPVFPSVGLGSGVVTPLDMAVAYSTLSNQGSRVAPLSVTKIVQPSGSVTVNRPVTHHVLQDGVAYEVTKVLHGNVLAGTGTAANIGPAIAGKTGTTNNYVDAWFMGYTPCYVTAVWVGYPNASGTPKFMTDVHGITVAGATFPAHIWAAFMRNVLNNPTYACPLSDYPLPSNPVTWKPFSSPNTQFVAPVTAPTTSSGTTAPAATTAPARKPTPATHSTPVVTPPATTPAPTPTPTPPTKT
jgi:penicillin-binding protein 1A